MVGQTVSMNREIDHDYSNPYLAELGMMGSERMSIIRSTLWVCATVLICVLLAIGYGYHKNRFEIVQNPKGIFIIDRKTTTINFCDEKRCYLVGNEFVFPRQPIIPPQMMMPQNQMMQQPQIMQQQGIQPQGMQQELLPQRTAPTVAQRPGTTAFSSAQTTYNRTTTTKRPPAPKRQAPAAVQEEEAPAAEEETPPAEEPAAKEEAPAEETPAEETPAEETPAE